MAEVGCEVGNDFSPQQLEAISLFATGQYNCTEVAERVGVTVQTISTWRKNYQFMDEIYNQAKQQLKNKIPEIYKATVDKATKGSHQHIKLILDHLEYIEKIHSKANKASISFTWDIDEHSNTL